MTNKTSAKYRKYCVLIKLKIAEVVSPASPISDSRLTEGMAEKKQKYMVSTKSNSDNKKAQIEANKFLCFLMKMNGKNTNAALKQLQIMPNQYCQDCAGPAMLLINTHSFIANAKIKNITKNCWRINPIKHLAARFRNDLSIGLF